MLTIRNQLICLSIAMLLVVCFQPDQINGQIKKKKLLKGLMGASLLKLFKSKKGVLPIPLPLPLPLPIDWHTQAGLLNKNNAPAHVSHQPYAQGIQMSPIEYADYQNAISQALSNSNTYIPSSYSSQSAGGYSTQQDNSASVGQGENSGYGSNQGASNSYDGSSQGVSNSYDGSNQGGSNGYEGSNENSNNYNSAPASYGVNGVGQNDEYNAYQVSNSDNTSGGYRSAASSINPNYNVHYNQQSSYNYGNYVPNYGNNQYNNAQNDYSQQMPQSNEQQQQFNNFQNTPNQSSDNNYEDNNGSASSNSFVATNSQQNNYIPLRSVPIYQQTPSSNYQSSTYQAQTSNNQPQLASNGWVALD